MPATLRASAREFVSSVGCGIDTQILTETGLLGRLEPLVGGEGSSMSTLCDSESTRGMGGGGVGSKRSFSITLFLTSRPSVPRTRDTTSTEAAEGISSKPLLRGLLRGGIGQGRAVHRRRSLIVQVQVARRRSRRIEPIVPQLSKC